MECQATLTPLSRGPMGRLTSSRGQNTGASRLLANWTGVTQSRWTRVSVESQAMWTQPWSGLKTRRSTFSKDQNTGSLTQTGHHQLTPVTLVQYPTGRASHQISTQPCNTVMAEPTSSKMDNIIALTTQGSKWIILPAHPSRVPLEPGGLGAPQLQINPSHNQRTVVGLGPTLQRCYSGGEA